MGITVTPLLAPVPAEWDRALEHARIPRLVSVLQEAGFVHPTAPCQAVVTGPDGRREQFEGEVDELLGELLDALQPDDTLFLQLPGNADPPPKCYEIEPEGVVLPRFVQGVSLDLSRFLVVKQDPDGSLPCPECGEELTVPLPELLPPNWESLDDHLGLPRKCPACEAPTDPADLSRGPALLTRFWLSFGLANKARPAEPTFAPELLARLAEAVGCQLRPWYEVW